jgi:hypothetical protein
MFDDFKELLSVFNAHNVRYLIVSKPSAQTARSSFAQDDTRLLTATD